MGALKERKERWGKPGGGAGTASVSTMGSGHLSGPALHPAGNIPLVPARGVTPGWPCPGPFLRRSVPLGAERCLGWGKKTAVPTADPALPRLAAVGLTRRL